MPAQSTFCVEHVVWWTSAQYPYRLCVTGPLHPSKLTDPVAMLYIVSYFNTCVAHIAMYVFTFVSFCCLRLCYVHLCTWYLMTLMCMQLPPCSRPVAQARPKMSCIRLVYIYCHSLGNWIGLSAPGLEFIQASYTAEWSRGARTDDFRPRDV